MRVAPRTVNTEDCLSVNYRFVGRLSNTRRLKARTRILFVGIFDLQYADDAALDDTSNEGLQRTLDGLAGTYNRAGLMINTKTDVLKKRDHNRYTNKL